MWSRDLLRVLHGAGKVAEQLAHLQGPEVSTAAGRLAKHAVELARVAPHLFGQAEPHDTQARAAAAAAGSEPATTSVTTAAPAPTTAAPVTAAVTTAEDKDIAASLPPVEAFAPPEVDETAAPLPPATVTITETKLESKSESEQHGEQQQQQQQATPTTAAAPEEPSASHAWTEKHVPSSPLSRILGFGGLAARLAVGTAAEIVRSGGKSGTYSALISDANVDRLAETLCTMRGAALKLGQMLSIQDENLVPSKLAQALDRVRQKCVLAAVCGVLMWLVLVELYADAVRGGLP